MLYKTIQNFLQLQNTTQTLANLPKRVKIRQSTKIFVKSGRTGQEKKGKEEERTLKLFCTQLKPRMKYRLCHELLQQTMAIYFT